MTLVVGTAFPTGYVARYLERQPELAAQLRAAGLRVVVFEPKDVFDESPQYFEHLQTALSAAAATHGPGLYVASAWAGAVLRTKPLPQLDASPGVFVGYFAMGEGGAVFVRPNGEFGTDPALFAEAISGMMQGDR